MKEGTWLSGFYDDKWSIGTLADKRVCVLGYGAVGKEVTKRCLAFGTTITALRRRPGRTEEGGVVIDHMDELHSVLPSADVLVCTLPLTDTTRGIIGERELSMLPPRAVVINVGRGPLIDESALFHALETGRLSAGLDVWYPTKEEGNDAQRIPFSAYPFHTLSNVVMTPHIGGHS